MAKEKYVGYGGARGGGKSWAMRVKLVLMALRYPGLNALLLRRTLPELRENHLLPLMEMLTGVAAYRQSDRAFYFPNGSRIRLGYCDSETDIYQYQGQEYDVIGVEECTHFTWSQVQFLMTCNRSLRPDLQARMFFTGNPGGVGHGWFRRLFVKREFLPGECPADYAFIPATVEDNHILMARDPDYVRVLDSLPETLRRAHRYGDWDVFQGQFFADFRHNAAGADTGTFTHVIRPFDPPADWRIYRSFDFGYAKPFSVGWWAVDGEGCLYRILEWYGCTGEPNVGLRIPPEEIFRGIAKTEAEHPWLKGKPIYGVADPSIWDSSRGPSVAEQAAKQGIFFERGDNSRLAGWMQVHQRLAFDGNGRAMLYFFDNCRHAIRTLPVLQYDPRRPEDLDTDGEDHAADEIRYLCMARPIGPVKAAARPLPEAGSGPYRYYRI